MCVDGDVLEARDQELDAEARLVAAAVRLGKVAKKVRSFDWPPFDLDSGEFHLELLRFSFARASYIQAKNRYKTLYEEWSRES